MKFVEALAAFYRGKFPLQVMRLYWPKKEPPSVLPPGEGTWKPPVIRKVN
jgi:hypothetical protein